MSRMKRSWVVRVLALYDVPMQEAKKSAGTEGKRKGEVLPEHV